MFHTFSVERYVYCSTSARGMIELCHAGVRGQAAMNDEAKRNDERVRVRAYELWEKDGRPHGRNDEYWEEALRQIQEQERMKAAS